MTVLLAKPQIIDGINESERFFVLLYDVQVFQSLLVARYGLLVAQLVAVDHGLGIEPCLPVADGG